MQDFEFIAAQTVDEVIAFLSANGRTVRLLSGGTDLIVQLREGRKQADLVVDIKRIPAASQVEYSAESGLRIGAAVSCARLCQHAALIEHYPGLLDAISIIGGTQIQGRASVGGNLCNASPAADSAPALIVHRAVAVIVGPRGQRELPVEQLFAGPGRNALEADEFLLAVVVPPPAAGFGASYLRFIPRNEMDIAVVGAGASLTLSADGARIKQARISLGAVAPTPLLVEAAGAYLSGKEPSAAHFLEAARMAQAAARPISDMRGTIAQRKHLAMVLTRRALEKALLRARGADPDRGNGYHPA